MNREWQKIERKRKGLETEYEIQFSVLFLKQLESLQEALDRNLLDAVENVERYMSKGLDRIYEKMIIETADKFKADFLILKKDETRTAWETLVMDYIQRVGGNRITQITRYSKDYVLNRLRPILNTGIEKGDGIGVIARRIVQDIDEYKIGFSRFRSERIARTEIVGVSNWASLTSAQSAGLNDRVKKKWLCRVDGRERDSHRAMNSKPAIGMDEFFQVGNTTGGQDLMQFPGDARGSKGNVINCRCAIVYERADEIKKPVKVRTEKPVIDSNAYRQATSIKMAREISKEILERNTVLKVDKIVASGEMTLEQFNRYNKQINSLTSEYKLSPDIDAKSKTTLMFRSTSRTFGYVKSYSDRLSDVNFGHRYAKNQRTDLRAYTDSEGRFILSHKSKVDPINVDLATVTHEFAHVITLERMGVLSKFPEVRKFWSELVVLRKNYHAELRELIQKNDRDGYAQKFLGDYASTNANEFLAEGFTEYKLNSKPSKYAVLIGKLVDKYFKK